MADRTEVDGQPGVGDDASIPRDSKRPTVIDLDLPVLDSTETTSVSAVVPTDIGVAPVGPALPIDPVLLVPPSAPTAEPFAPPRYSDGRTGGTFPRAVARLNSVCASDEPARHCGAGNRRTRDDCAGTGRAQRHACEDNRRAQRHAYEDRNNQRHACDDRNYQRTGYQRTNNQRTNNQRANNNQRADNQRTLADNRPRDADPRTPPARHRAARGPRSAGSGPSGP